jgi:hypothetical protein
MIRSCLDATPGPPGVPTPRVSGLREPGPPSGAAVAGQLALLVARAMVARASRGAQSLAAC